MADRDDSLALAVHAARAAADLKASDIIVVDVGDILSITGYFVIAAGSNPRQVRAIVDDVEAKVKVGLGRAPLRVEGAREQQWTLIDYGDVVVHVFLDSVREFYEIERLYSDAPRIDWEQLPVGDGAGDGVGDQAGDGDIAGGAASPSATTPDE